MIAFTDIRNDEGGFDNVAFEYDERAELSAEFQTRLSEIDLGLGGDEIYAELDQLVFEFRDEIDVFSEIEKYKK